MFKMPMIKVKLANREYCSGLSALLFDNDVLFVQNDEDPILEGEKEAEKTIVEAYSALLLAFLSTERLV